MTTETILDTTVYRTPAGNYDGSSQDWFSDAVKAANYYRGQGHTQTCYFNLINFVGVIVIEATLQTWPGGADSPDYLTNDLWFEVARLGDPSSIMTEYRPITVLGNFTWLRARILDFSAGQIRAVTVVY